MKRGSFTSIITKSVLQLIAENFAPPEKARKFQISLSKLQLIQL
jgi:hypothetical protein